MVSGMDFVRDDVVVFDPDYRYPGHPAPGATARPAAAAATDGRPTDPAVLAEVRSLVRRFIPEHVRLEGEAPDYGTGNTEEQILAAEQRLGLRLPDDLRALYRVISSDSESGLLGWYSLVPLDQLVEWYHEDEIGSGGWSDGMLIDDPVAYETYPYGRVRPATRSDWWVTFGPDWGMNMAAVDLDPAPGGTFGQVVKYGRDVHGPVHYVAPSVLQMIRDAVETARTATGGEKHEWLAPHVDPGPHEWSADPRRTEQEEFPASPLIQEVNLYGGHPVSLAGLGGLPHLHAVVLHTHPQPAPSIDLAIEPGVPVELVDVRADAFDPSALAATTTLRYLRLSGNTEPVRVGALATLPSLIRVDLAGAAVEDIASLAGFAAVRVLTLNGRQWRELLDTGWSPRGLAIARLSGVRSDEETAAWRAAMGAPS